MTMNGKQAAVKWVFLIGVLSVVAGAHAQKSPPRIEVPGGPMPIWVLAQSPADTSTDLQVICLFRSSPVNTLHGSLVEINEKLNGLLDRIRKPELFRGELGETLVIRPPKGSLAAHRLLIIGLGDSQTFTPQRMQLVGEILYREASDLGVKHPFFAPTILDGGVSKFTTGPVAEQVITGFLRADATEKALASGSAAHGSGPSELTYLAGVKNVGSTRDGIMKVISGAAQR
jgi:hypothetical protein